MSVLVDVVTSPLFISVAGILIASIVIGLVKPLNRGLVWLVQRLLRRPGRGMVMPARWVPVKYRPWASFGITNVGEGDAFEVRVDTNAAMSARIISTAAWPEVRAGRTVQFSIAHSPVAWFVTGFKVQVSWKDAKGRREVLPLYFTTGMNVSPPPDDYAPTS